MRERGRDNRKEGGGKGRREGKTKGGEGGERQKRTLHPNPTTFPNIPSEARRSGKLTAPQATIICTPSPINNARNI